MRSIPVVAALALSLVATAALAQSAPPRIIRGEIVSVDGANLAVKTKSGESLSLHLKDGQPIAAVIPATLADIKPGVFVGTAAVPGKDGALTAMEVHIFPEAMRGTGEGFRPFDLAPGSTMTNGDVNARVDAVDGPQIVVAYNGGQKSITIDKSTPIVTIEPGGLGDLMAGAAIVARGGAGAGGDYEARNVVVGVNGLTPPM